MNEQTYIEPQKALFIGLDLGQKQDYSALAIIESVRETAIGGENSEITQLNCIHLQRWQLRTSYPQIVTDVVKMINGLERQRIGTAIPVLCVDATGCGAAVIDLFKAEKINAELLPIMITCGATVTDGNGTTNIPKRDLVSVIQVGLQNGTLKIASQLPEADTLSRELQNFTVKITDAANDIYGTWRDGTHDDLVLAAALAVWKASQPPQYWQTMDFRI